MSIENLMKMVKGHVMLKDLKNENEFIAERSKVSDYLDVSLEKVYFQPEQNIFFIMEGFLVMEVPNIFHGASEIADYYKNMWQQMSKQTWDMNKEEDIQKLLYMCPEKLRVQLFLLMYSHMNQPLRYELWKNTYTAVDYGHEHLLEIIRECYDKETATGKEELMAKHGQDVITIYRGETNESTLAEQAYSWTDSKKTALFFANRYNSSKHRLIEAQVAISDIFDYFDQRESEVLVSYPSVKVSRITEVEGIEETLQRFQDKWILSEDGENGEYAIDLYHEFVGYLDEEWFFHYEGIHGELHMKRVMLHVLNISHYQGLTLEETKLLLNAALYHDIGRTNDYVCEEHGKLSVEKIHEQGLPYHDVKMEDETLLEFIISHHNLDNQWVEEKIQAMDMTDETKAWWVKMYHCFCDADVLDRKRIGDLNPNYLHFEESKLMMAIASEFLKYIK